MNNSSIKLVNPMSSMRYKISNIYLIEECFNMDVESCLHMSKELTIPPHMPVVCSQRPLLYITCIAVVIGGPHRPPKTVVF